MSRIYISIFLLLLMQSASIYGKQTGSYCDNSAIMNDILKQVNEFLQFEPKSTVLKRQYLDNNTSLENLELLIVSNLEDLKSGKSHLAITGYILSDETDSAEVINQISVQMSVAKSYLKRRYHLTNSCFTFCIDNSQNQFNNFVEISFVNSSVATDDSQALYYTLKPTTSNLKIVLSSYGKIPYKKTLVIPFEENISDSIVVEKVKERIQYDLPSIMLTNKVSGITYQTVDSLPKEVINSYRLKKKLIEETNDSIFAASFAARENRQEARRTHRIIYPTLGIKTNLIYWAGYIPSLEVGKQSYIPNIELEGYFSQRFSISIDGIYTPLFTNSEGLQWWKVNGIAMETRVWLGEKNVFKGFYSGLYVITGEFDIMKESIGMYGYTGKYYGGGLSLGFVKPIFKALHLEIGARCGFRDDNWDSYEIEDGKSYYLSSGSRRVFKLQGLRFCLMLRFGKTVKKFVK